MTTLAIFSAGELLVELDRLSVGARIHEGRVNLHPASRIPPDVLQAVQASKVDILCLLTDPRRRWHEQAEALVAQCPAADCEDILHLFDEREAIASVDGGQDDHAAGQLAYEMLKNHIRENCS